MNCTIVTRRASQDKKKYSSIWQSLALKCKKIVKRIKILMRLPYNFPETLAYIIFLLYLCTRFLAVTIGTLLAFYWVIIG